MAVVINRRFTASITFHEVLHSFWVGCITGTATLDAKLLQQLVSMREEVLYVIFLDLHKAYGALDRDRCLEILEGYRLGPWDLRILQDYWCILQMVARVGVYYGADFNGCSGATLVLVGGRDIRREGRVGKGGATPWHIFYADDGMVASTDPDWLQGEFDTLTGIFILKVRAESLTRS